MPQPTLVTTCDGMIASHTTDLPRPSTQLIADGFLSVQKFPLSEITSNRGNFSCRKAKAFSTPYKKAFLNPWGQTPLTIPFHAIWITRCYPLTGGYSRTLESMFMPMASPVLALKRMYSSLPARDVCILFSRAKRLVELKASSTNWKLSALSNQTFT